MPALSPEEVRRLLDAAPGFKYRLLLSLTYGCGLRVSEVVSLKVCDIDNAQMVIRIEQGKGRKDRKDRYDAADQPCSICCGSGGSPASQWDFRRTRFVFGRSRCSREFSAVCREVPEERPLTTVAAAAAIASCPAPVGKNAQSGYRKLSALAGLAVLYRAALTRPRPFARRIRNIASMISSWRLGALQTLSFRAHRVRLIRLWLYEKMRLLNRECPCFMPTASAEAGSKG